MIPKYQIGQQLWRPTFDAHETWIRCPDCAGTGRLRVILGNDEVVSIECAGCQVGYDPPLGQIKVYNREPRAEAVTITEIRMVDGAIQYNWSFNEDNLFIDCGPAYEAAKEMAVRYDEDERARIATKEKPTRTWAWHAHYHRKEIKDLERRIAYHRAKLTVAAGRVKELGEN